MNLKQNGTEKKYGEDDEYMSHLVSYKSCRLNQYIPELWGFYKNVGILLGGCLTVKNIVICLMEIESHMSLKNFHICGKV